MCAELANLNHCTVPFLSRAAVDLSWYDSRYTLHMHNKRPFVLAAHMSMFYAVVARKSTILAKHAQCKGNFDQVSHCNISSYRSFLFYIYYAYHWDYSKFRLCLQSAGLRRSTAEG